MKAPIQSEEEAAEFEVLPASEGEVGGDRDTGRRPTREEEEGKTTTTMTDPVTSTAAPSSS